ncbi:hypothetical protein FRC09_013895 [Ceratobasidium sp. 395]|nr:hypothetical protein FRC09_013895 [Ceratobasidium sp. 395]
MPAQRIGRSRSNRSTPLPEGHYGIPRTLPPSFGVDELFNWSSRRLPSSSSSGTSSTPSVFKRYHQKVSSSSKLSTSVRTWVDGQDTLASPSKNNDSSDVISIASTTADERPLFLPTHSPAPSKSGSSRVPLQLATPDPSPIKLEPKYRAPQMASSQVDHSIHTTRKDSSSPSLFQAVRPNIVQRHPKPASTTASNNEQHYTSGRSSNSSHEYKSYKATTDSASDVEDEFDEDQSDEDEAEGYQNEDHGGPDDGDESGDESDSDESDFDTRGRMRASRYIDNEAQESRATKRSAPVQHIVSDGSSRWTGGLQGLLSFRKRPNSAEVMPPGKWSFSNDGAARQPLRDREVGDIHFSPAYSGETGDDYWVLVNYPKRRWLQCAEGQSHPTAAGYVLRPRNGNKPPQWILEQSLRTNKWRGRPRYSD